jgi:hypothetical protein
LCLRPPLRSVGRGSAGIGVMTIRVRMSAGVLVTCGRLCCQFVGGTGIITVVTFGKQMPSLPPEDEGSEGAQHKQCD